MNEPSIATLVANLTAATAALCEAEKKESFARSDRNNCINRLNEAQKALDAAIEKLRKDAPQSSDWKSRQRGQSL